MNDIIDNRYECVRCLGSGPNAVVYLVKDLASEGRQLALKMFRPPKESPHEVRCPLKSEFEMLAGLHHPNLAEVYQFGALPQERTWYFTSQFCPGIDLMRAASELSLDQLLSVTVQVCRALQYIHSRGIVHGDVKPSNIIVDMTTMQARLVDFGIARAVSMPGETKVAGTPAYMPPEVIRGEPADARSDLYSLGATLYHVTTKEPPFSGASVAEVLRAHLTRIPARPSSKIPGYPAPLERLIMRLLSKELFERFADANEVIEAINEFSSVRFKFDASEKEKISIYGSKLVGRDLQFAQLSASLDLMLEGVPEAKLLLVTGEYGIGKSRLLREFRIHAQLEGVRVFMSACRPGMTTPLSPFVEILRQLAPSASETLRQQFRVLIEEVAARSASKFFDEAQQEAFPRSMTKERWLDGLTNLLLRHASETPTVLLLDDLHWADELTWEAILYILRNARIRIEEHKTERERFQSVSLVPAASAGAAQPDAGLRPAQEPIPRLLICATMLDVPGEAPLCAFDIQRMRAGQYVKDVPLPRLDEPEVGQMIQSMLGMSSDLMELSRSIFDLTQGNPLFVEETIRFMAETGQLIFGRRGWQARLDVENGLELPTGLSTVIEQRIGHLSDDSRNVLEVISVTATGVGTEFISSILEIDVAPLNRALDDLLKRGMLRREGGGDGITYRCSGEMIRRTAYERMGEARRRDLHRSIGLFLEKTGKMDISEELAHHFAMAGDCERTARYASAAAAAAEKVGATRQALRLFEIALKNLPAGSERRVETFMRISALRAGLGEIEAAQESARCALSEGADRISLDKKAEILTMMAEFNMSAGRLSEAEPLFNQALQIATAENQAGRIAQAYAGLAWLSMSRYNWPEMEQMSRRALEYAAKVNDMKILMRVHNILGAFYFNRGDYYLAVDHFSESLRCARKSGSAANIAVILSNIALVYSAMPNLGAAREHSQQALAAAARAHSKYADAMAVSVKSTVDWLGGDIAAAIRNAREAIRTWAELGNAHQEAESMQTLATFLAARGNYIEALQIALAAWRTRRRIRASGSEIVASLMLLASLAVSTGRTDTGLRLARIALRMAEKFRESRLQALAAKVAAEALSRKNCHEEAEELLRKCLAAFLKLNAMFEAAETYSQLGVACARQHRFEEALRHSSEAVAIAEKLSSPPLSCTVLVGHADCLLSTNSQEHLPTALDCLFRAMMLAEMNAQRELLWRGALLLGRACARLGRPVEAMTHLRKACDTLERIAADMPERLRGKYLSSPHRQEAFQEAEKLRSEILGAPAITRPASAAADKRHDIAKLRRITNAIISELDFDALLILLVDSILDLTYAERGFFILCTGREFHIKVARTREKQEVPAPEDCISKTIVEKAIASGEVILTQDARADGTVGQFDSVSRLQLRSVLCIPLKMHQRVIGAIYMDNRFEAGVFTEEDVIFLEPFCDQAAIATENARLHHELLLSRKQIEQLNDRLKQQLEDREQSIDRAERDLHHKQKQLEEWLRFENIVGVSPPMKRIFAKLEQASQNDVNVLIWGESGTGKELVAKAIHFNGPRRKAPFIAENCAAISESLFESEMFGHVKGAFTGAHKDKKGLFELASGGTLFLDEIGEMPMPMQAKLLRAIEESRIRRVGAETFIPIHTRIIAASNKDLARQAELGHFRKDLYYRLNTIEIRLPALRERKEDIPYLIRYFLARHEKERGCRFHMSRDAMNALIRYDWPGNVRELSSVIQQAVMMSHGGKITIEHLPELLHPNVTASRAHRAEGGLLKDSIRERVAQVLEQTNRNKSKAAELLGISRGTLYRLIEKYGL